MSERKPVSEYAQPHIQTLRAYTPGFQPKESGWIKLNTNENPYPPSPKVEEALKDAVGPSLRLYPDPTSAALREAVARINGVDSSCAFIGNGSDDILNLLTRAFSDSARFAGYTFPSYSLYPVLCGIQNSGIVEIPFGRSMVLPLEPLLDCDARILFFTSPNAPTGVGFSNDDLRTLVAGFDGIVVIDEAYADFAKETAVELLSDFDNLVITRTFSKSYSLAGMRIGYALTHPDVVEVLDKVRDSYNVGRLAQVAGLAAVADQSYLKAIVGKIKQTRDHYVQELRDLGWFVYDSQANLIFAEPKDAKGYSGPEVAQSLFEFLKSEKILVRYFAGHALTDTFLRISVGDDDQMLALSESIQKWLKNE